jgi:hypothetical protein
MQPACAIQYSLLSPSCQFCLVSIINNSILEGRMGGGGGVQGTGWGRGGGGVGWKGTRLLFLDFGDLSTALI